MARTLSVMVVDDNEATRLILGDMIVSFGHRVAAQADGLEPALASYRVHKPDFVTLDLSLSGHDGLSILKALRALNPAVKALIVTGNSQQKVFDALMAAGAWGYLAKPIKPEDLKAALERAARE